MAIENKDIIKEAKNGSKAGGFYKKDGNWFKEMPSYIDKDVFLGAISSESEFVKVAKEAGKYAGLRFGSYDYADGAAFVYDNMLFTLNYQNETKYGVRYILTARDVSTNRFKEFAIYDKYDNPNSFGKWIKSSCEYRMPEILESGIQKSDLKAIDKLVTQNDAMVTTNNDLKDLMRAISKDKSGILLEADVSKSKSSVIKNKKTRAVGNAKKLAKPLKPIKSNVGLERLYKKSLAGFTNTMLKSVRYWSVAQINKYNRGEIKNVSNALKVEFNELLKAWSEKAEIFGARINAILEKRIRDYVDNAYIAQNPFFKIKGLDTMGKQSLQSMLLQNLSLIKSIPQEIIKKHEIVLYNAVNNFDKQNLAKQLKNISSIENNRIKLIARDQIAKAIESYSSARAQDLGFDYYVWNTSKDERVSKGEGGHNKLEGRIYAYNTPTAIIDSKGTKGHPAQRVNCRCVATALFLEPNQELKLVRDSEAGDYYEISKK